MAFIAQLVKNLPAMQETLVRFLGGEDPLRRDRLHTPVFLGFLCGSTGKESTCNEGDLGSIPWMGRSLGEGKGYPVFWPGEFQGLYSPGSHRKSDATEPLLLSFSLSFILHQTFLPTPFLHHLFFSL